MLFSQKSAINSPFSKGGGGKGIRVILFRTVWIRLQTGYQSYSHNYRTLGMRGFLPRRIGKSETEENANFIMEQ